MASPSSVRSDHEYPHDADSGLPTSPLANWRDLGGIPVADGVLRESVLWRSDDVSTIPEAEAERLHSAGLRDVLDLRSPHEAQVAGRGPLRRYPVAYHHLPLSATAAAPGMSPEAVSSLTPEGVGTWYVQIAEQTAPQLIEGLRVAASSTGAALFHCAAGKDRTGVFTAALLGVLGAQDEAIIEDYGRTDAVMPDIMRRISPMMQAVVRDHDAPRLDPAAGGALFAAPAETMAVMLRVMKHEHGSILDLLRGRGLDDATITALRERVVH